MNKRIALILIAVLAGSVLFVGFLVPLDSEVLEVVVVKSWKGVNQKAWEYNYEVVYDNNTLTFEWKDSDRYLSGDRLKLKYNIYLFRKTLIAVWARFYHEQRLSFVTRNVFRQGRIINITYHDSLNETLFVHFEIKDCHDLDTVLWEFARNDSNFTIIWNAPSRYVNYCYVLRFKLKYESKVFEQRAILYGEFA